MAKAYPQDTKTLTLGELAVTINAELTLSRREGGDPGLDEVLGATPISGVAALTSAGPQQVSFFTHPRYREQLLQTRAAAVIVAPAHLPDCPVAALVTANPLLSFARAAGLFEASAGPLDTGDGADANTSAANIHPSAWVSRYARVSASAMIGPHSVIEAGAMIDDRVSIGPGCVIGRGVSIAADSRLVARVTLCHGVRIGYRVLIHPGAVIGSDGFGLAPDRGRWVKIPQLGGVVIGDDVEVGANTTIDRGALDDTVVEQGVKLDNQIQIAHNVVIGAHTAIAGCVGIAGSARIGRHCMIGGGVGIAGHLDITDGVQVTGMSLVASSIDKPGVYSSGLTVARNRDWNKISARLRKLDDLARRLQTLEKAVKQTDT